MYNLKINMDACETQHQKGVCIIIWKVFYFPLSLVWAAFSV